MHSHRLLSKSRTQQTMRLAYNSTDRPNAFHDNMASNALFDTQAGDIEYALAFGDAKTRKQFRRFVNNEFHGGEISSVMLASALGTISIVIISVLAALL